MPADLFGPDHSVDPAINAPPPHGNCDWCGGPIFKFHLYMREGKAEHMCCKREHKGHKQWRWQEGPGAMVLELDAYERSVVITDEYMRTKMYMSSDSAPMMRDAIWEAIEEQRVYDANQADAPENFRTAGENEQ